MGTCQGLLVSPRLIERKRDGPARRHQMWHGRMIRSSGPARLMRLRTPVGTEACVYGATESK